MTAIPQEELANLGEAIERFNDAPTDLDLALNLSRSFRFRELHDVALPFAVHGLAIADRCDDQYFMLKAEVATSGFYSNHPKMRELGHTACEELALSRDCHPAARHVSFQNLFHYTKKFSDYAPSLENWRVDLTPMVPDRYYPTNPSICRVKGLTILNVRCVNYYTDLDEKVILPDVERLRTRNLLFLMRDDLLDYEFMGEIQDPVDLPIKNRDMPLGIEDIRLFPHNDDLMFSGTVVQANEDKMAEIMSGRIDPISLKVRDWAIMSVAPDRHEKNWSPITEPGFTAYDPVFIYSHDPLRLIGRLDDLSSEIPPIAAHTWSGSTQAIPFSYGSRGGRLVMIHEKTYEPDFQITRRRYQQRFVWYSRDWQLGYISRRFEFDNGETEFPCGMCWHPNGKRLVISYGVLDREAWLATVSADEIRDMLYPV